MARYLPSPTFVFGAFFGLATFFLIFGVTSYQSDRCRYIETSGQTSGKIGAVNIVTPSEDDDREAQITEYTKTHGWVCGIFGFPRMLIGFMDHHEGFFVAAFTFALVIVTGALWTSTEKLFRAGERQIDTAIKSADAAEQGAKAALLALASERAWILPEQAITGVAINCTLEDGLIVVNGIVAGVKWKNFGRSPSIKTTFMLKIEMIPIGQTTIPEFGVVFPENSASSMMAPGISSDCGPLLLSEEYSKKFRRKEIAAIVYSSVKYFDVFDTKSARLTEACFRIVYSEGTKTVDGKESPAWDISSVGDQNRAI